MINFPELVCDRDIFDIRRRECESIIDTQSRLPDFVFRRAFDSYFVIEHTLLHWKEFGDFLYKLSSLYGDALVNYMTVDPDPVDYYYREFSFFGLASFQPSTLTERYNPVMSLGGDAESVESFLAGGDIGVFWGSSQKWGIFCDRVSWEIAVIAVSGNVDVPAISGFRCMDASALSEYMDAQYRRLDPAIAERFMQTFSRNYTL